MHLKLFIYKNVIFEKCTLFNIGRLNLSGIKFILIGQLRVTYDRLIGHFDIIKILLDE